jgi:DNA invertase Pin-like site-specific DNA recombinase
MERPTLRQLLSDIDAGNVDIVVVYTVDRLTRSLAAFAMIVERLDPPRAKSNGMKLRIRTTGIDEVDD